MKITLTLLLLLGATLGMAQKTNQTPAEMMRAYYTTAEIETMKTSSPDKYALILSSLEYSHIFSLEEKKSELGTYPVIEVKNYKKGKVVNFLLYDILPTEIDQYFRIGNTQDILLVRGKNYINYINQQK